MELSKKLIALLLVLPTVALALAAAGCNVDPNIRAAQTIRSYLAPDGSHPLKGLTLTSLGVTGKRGERTLNMEVASDESGQASLTLNWLAIGGTSDEGWIADLNKAGLGLAFADIRVTYASGIPDELNVIDVARHRVSTSGGPSWPDIGPTPPTTPISPQTS